VITGGTTGTTATKTAGTIRDIKSGSMIFTATGSKDRNINFMPSKEI
jgi:hypothetical protein